MATHKDRRTIAAALTALLCLAGHATIIDLGDLNVPSDRVPQWYSPSEVEASYVEAKSWQEYDVTCKSGPCPSGKAPIPDSWGCPTLTKTNWDSAINCMIGAAPPKTVLFFPSGTHDIDYAAVISRSDIVLRGAGRKATVLNVKYSGRGFVGNDTQCGANSGASAISICNPNYDGQGRAWTAGYGRGETVLTLAGTAGFTKGGWVHLRMSGSRACEYTDKVLNAGGEPDGFVHMDRVLGVGTVDGLKANQIRIERGLRMNYVGSGCNGHEAFPWDPLVNVGIENLRITSDPSLPVGKPGIYFSGIKFQGVAGSWMVGCRIDRFYSGWMSVFYSARLWIQGNDWLDLDESIVYGSGGVVTKFGATDIVIENNYFTGARVSNQNAGSEGTIVAYNYMRQAIAERSIFNHGWYNREHLFEGNDINAPIMVADCWWSRNGPRITAFRNRNVNTGNDLGSIATSYMGCGGSYPDVIYPTCSYLNLFGNIASIYYNFPTVGNPPDEPRRPIDWSIEYAWLEKNIARNSINGGILLTGMDGSSKNTTTSCGTGPNDPCPGLNVVAMANPPEWDNDKVPPSLYRTEPPSWWCEEACSWDDVHNGIGAWGDDFNNISSLCKLPAQIRAEGGTCTPLRRTHVRKSISHRDAQPFFQSGTIIVLRNAAGPISVYSVLGRKVLSAEVNETGPLDVSHLPSGTYYVKIPGWVARFVRP